MKSGPFLSIPNFIKSKLLCCIFGIILYPLPRGKCKRDSQKGKKREISAARCDFSEKLCPSYPPTPLVAGGNFPYTTSCHIFRCIRRCGVSQFFPEKEFSHEKSADSSAVPRDALLPRRLRAERPAIRPTTRRPRSSTALPTTRASIPRWTSTARSTCCSSTA